MARDQLYKFPPAFLFEDAMIEDLQIVDVALGERHTLLLQGDGTVLASGWNMYGQLGIGAKDTAVVNPVVVVINVPDLEMDEGEEGGSGGNANAGEQNGQDAVGNTVNDGILYDNATNATFAGNDTVPPEINVNVTTSTVDSTPPLMETLNVSHPPSASPLQPSAIPSILINIIAIANISAGRGSSYFITQSRHVFYAGTNSHVLHCLKQLNEQRPQQIATQLQNDQDRIIVEGIGHFHSQFGHHGEQSAQQTRNEEEGPTDISSPRFIEADSAFCQCHGAEDHEEQRDKEVRAGLLCD
mmetsp:Transcript_26415/g.53548  ORF Transcript_26415/g.53548 Transcript_26415/m.53548 type:complete len:299 (-) Transcript_26415:95-991(-)